jgi:hypothetical protein
VSGLDFLLTSPGPRGPSPREEALFRAAFVAELEDDPDRPPRPATLARAVGHSGPQLTGRLSRLRRQMLRDAGFVQPGGAGARWRKA